jgi:AhpD family alkylhydroperoxidase
MTETIGGRPALFDRIPDEFVGPEWDLMKRAAFGETLIPRKYKDLIGLAVAAVTHCRYGILFHTEGARLAGASEAEIAEALHHAGLVSGWGVMLDGLAVSYDDFESEVRRTVAHLSAEGGPG